MQATTDTRVGWESITTRAWWEGVLTPVPAPSGNAGSQLQRQLDLVASQPHREWVVAVDNVPTWPCPPVLLPGDPTSDWRYAKLRGEDDLLAQVVATETRKGRRVDAGEVLVTHGAIHALGLVARHARAQGCTSVVCQAPVLGIVADLLRSSGLRLVAGAARELPEIVAGLPGYAPLLVYLNSPHNPTGEVLDERVLMALRASRPGVQIVLDEVYDAFDFSGRPALPRHTGDDGIIVVNSMSKSYGAPGLRIGWIVAAPRTIASLTARLDFETIAVSSQAQHHAAALLARGNDELVERVARGRRAAQLWWSARGRGGTIVGAGGSQAWVPVPGVPGDPDWFTDVLASDLALVLTSSENYYSCPAPHVRVPLGLPADQLAEILRLLGAGLDRSLAER